MKFTILNMSDDANKGDLGILESTVGVIQKYVSNPEISILNIDYTDEEIASPALFPHLKILPITHLGAFFPRIFVEERSPSRLLKGIFNLIISLWVLGVVCLFQKRSRRLIPSNFHNQFQAILDADLIILKGGSYIFSYGGFKQFIFLYRMLYTTFISIFLNKKIFVWGHSVGPLIGYASQFLARYCLKRSSKIVVREEISYRFVTEELDLEKEKVELHPDLAFWFKKPLANKSFETVIQNENFTQNNTKSLKIGLTVRQWHFPLQKENPEQLFNNYLTSLAGVLDKLSHEFNAEFYIMPHNLKDLPTAHQLVKYTRHAKPYILTGDYSTDTLRYLYGKMDIFIGTRIHSDIFALSQGTPVIGIAYEIPKGYGIIGMVEGSEYIIDISKINEDTLWQKVSNLYREKELKKALIQRKIKSMREEIETYFDNFLKKEFPKTNKETEWQYL